MKSKIAFVSKHSDRQTQREYGSRAAHISINKVWTYPRDFVAQRHYMNIWGWASKCKTIIKKWKDSEVKQLTCLATCDIAVSVVEVRQKEWKDREKERNESYCDSLLGI